MSHPRIKGHFAWLIAAAVFCAAAPSAFAPALSAEPSAEQWRPPAPVARRLQMGVGKSVIVDLPEEAGEIFVGNPAVANAIVRSARRLYIDAIANGQTTIFAMDRQGRQIAVIEISVGRDVGELKALLNAAMPGNDITVKTVADSIILMGSVASAAEAQKALDIASGFIGVTAVPAQSTTTSASTASAGAASTGSSSSGTTTTNGTSTTVSSPPQVSSGKLINSLTIRGA